MWLVIVFKNVPQCFTACSRWENRIPLRSNRSQIYNKKVIAYSILTKPRCFVEMPKIQKVGFLNIKYPSAIGVSSYTQNHEWKPGRNIKIYPKQSISVFSFLILVSGENYLGQIKRQKLFLVTTLFLKSISKLLYLCNAFQ